jgi:hypothetical protein
VAGHPIQEFCGMKAKLYSIKVSAPVKNRDGTGSWINQKSATAGTKTHLARKYLHHQKFMEVFNQSQLTVQLNQKSIRSFNHKLYNVDQLRTSISAIDDKRYVLPDGSTRALGHYKNSELTTQEELLKLLDDMNRLDGEEPKSGF